MGLAQRARFGAAFALAAFAALCVGAARAQQHGDEDVDALDLVRVVGVTPVTGTELPAAKLPYDVQSIDDAAFGRAQVPSLADFLDRHLAGVSVNAAQNGPLQPDLQFRGYTATPLLGGSEGLSVYLDGVRVNEVFGDTVNWDLVPDAAIERMSLLAGANPVFGLNTLGGAISIRTKSGFSDPGTRFEAEGGSSGRSDATFETAGTAGAWGWYLVGRRFDERGWRDASPSNARNVYGTWSWRGDAASFDLHLGRGDTDLTGNGPAPVQLLAARWQGVFTSPDETANRMDLVSGEGSIALSAHAKLSFTLFRRDVTTRSYNGDGTDFERCAGDAAILCDDDGEPVLDQHGDALPASFDAIGNISRRRQRGQGGTVQFAFDAPLAGRENQFVAGFDVVDGRLRFDSAVEAAVLDEERHASADSGLFVPADALALRSRTRSLGLYATDTLSLTDRLALTASARANRTRTTIADLSGAHPDLDGRHAFSRINPAVGATWRWSDALDAYAGVSESTRAPTPVELTCADEDAPCKLPNQFLGDPPLKQVVAKGWEAGLRGALAGDDGDRIDWRVGLFRTTNADDILFQATGGTQSNEGFFANVGDTRRQGLQAGASGTAFGRRLSWHANASWLDATYRTGFVESSANHPDADDDGLIAVHRGDRIPGLPRWSAKVGADFALTPTFSIGGDLVANAGQYLRGDEANRLPRTGGWAVLDLRASWTIGARASVFARIDNAFDRRYVTFGTLGDPGDVFPGFDDPRFLGPAPPRGAWVGLRLSL
ncbi:MAG TPA: TonB-dependent receptor [Dokdonella sp.]|nr:TonB-dependent receptor [Dokdonella sp.]